MYHLRRVTAVAALTVAFGGVLTGVAGSASADTGACASYLEEQGEDNTARYQVCAETETLGDTVSAQYAVTVCVPLMSVTALPERLATEACHLAVEP